MLNSLRPLALGGLLSLCSIMQGTAVPVQERAVSSLDMNLDSFPEAISYAATIAPVVDSKDPKAPHYLLRLTITDGRYHTKNTFVAGPAKDFKIVAISGFKEPLTIQKPLFRNYPELIIITDDEGLEAIGYNGRGAYEHWSVAYTKARAW